MFTGIIYKITGSCGKVYIGSTTDFAQRKRGHNSSRNDSSSKLLQKPLKFEIIRTDEYNTKRIMFLVEQFYLDSVECVNERSSFINRKLYCKKYREDNKEEIKLRQKKNYQNNKEKYAEKNKKYRENNKEEIKKRSLSKVKCECGCVVTRASLFIHKKSKKHLSILS